MIYILAFLFSFLGGGLGAYFGVMFAERLASNSIEGTVFRDTPATHDPTVLDNYPLDPL